MDKQKKSQSSVLQYDVNQIVELDTNIEQFRDGRCYLTEQPIVILASMCRFLTSRELASVDCTNRLMSQAASHPIVYRTNEETRIESTFNSCSSHLSDCPVTFEFCDSYQLGSRRLSSMRSLRLVEFASRTQDFSRWPQLSSLRALDIVFTNAHSYWTKDSNQRVTLSLDTLTHLRMLQLTATDQELSQIVPLLPSSLDHLHLNFSDALTVTLYTLTRHLKRPTRVASKITHLVLQAPPPSNTIEQMQLVHQLEQLPQLKEVHYRVLITLSHHMSDLMNLMKEMKSKKVERYFRQPALQLDVHDVNSHILVTFLSQFAHLIRLDLYPLSRMIDYARTSTDVAIPALYTFAPWPTCVQCTLQELRVRVTNFSDVSLLLTIGIERLETLEIAPSAPCGTFNSEPIIGTNARCWLTQLFQANPHLTHMDIPLIDLGLYDLLAFQHLPLLRKLHLRWPSRGEHVPLPADGLASVFPSLIQLCVSESTAESLVVPTRLLLTIPLLSRFKWRYDSWVASRQAMVLIFTRIDQFEKEKRDAAALSSSRTVPPVSDPIMVRPTRAADIARALSAANEKLKSEAPFTSITVSASLTSPPTAHASLSWSSLFAPVTNTSTAPTSFSFPSKAETSSSAGPMCSLSTTFSEEAITTGSAPNPFALRGSPSTSSNLPSACSSQQVAASSSAPVPSSSNVGSSTKCHFVSAASLSFDELRLLLLKSRSDDSDHPQLRTHDAFSAYLVEVGISLDVSLVLILSSHQNEGPQPIAVSLVAEESIPKLLVNQRQAYISDFGVVSEYRTKKVELLLLQTQLDLLRADEFDIVRADISPSHPLHQVIFKQAGFQHTSSSLTSDDTWADFHGSLPPIDYSSPPLTGCTIVSLPTRHLNQLFRSEDRLFAWSHRLSYLRTKFSQPNVSFLGLRKNQLGTVITSIIEPLLETPMPLYEIGAFIILQVDKNSESLSDSTMTISILDMYGNDLWCSSRFVYFLQSRYPPTTIFSMKSENSTSSMATAFSNAGLVATNLRHNLQYDMKSPMVDNKKPGRAFDVQSINPSSDSPRTRVKSTRGTSSTLTNSNPFTFSSPFSPSSSSSSSSSSSNFAPNFSSSFVAPFSVSSQKTVSEVINDKFAPIATSPVDKLTLAPLPVAAAAASLPHLPPTSSSFSFTSPFTFSSSSSSSIDPAPSSFSSFGSSSFVFESASTSAASSINAAGVPTPSVTGTVSGDHGDADVDEEELRSAFHAFAASFQLPSNNKSSISLATPSGGI